LRRLPEVRVARLAVLALAVGVAVLLPGLAGAGRPDFASLSVVYAILGVSLVVLTGWAGQISLGQFGFAALGALVAGQLAANHGVDFFVTLVAAGAAGALVAVVIGVPALRISGPFLAVVTLAFAAFTTNYLLQPDKASWLFPALEGPVARPVLWGAVDVSSPGRFYVVCLAVLGLCLLAARSLRRSRSGRLLLAVRDNPRAAQAYGVSLARAKLTAFAVSGFIAAVGGALLSYVLGTVDPSGFPIGISIGVFAMAVIGGLTSLPGTLLGALYYTGFLYLVADGRFSTLATGVGLTLLLLFFPGGLAQLAYNGRDAFVRWAARRHDLAPTPPPADETPLQRRRTDDRPLQEAAP
jgi:branched-chain amino acid transport system permease protein